MLCLRKLFLFKYVFPNNVYYNYFKMHHCFHIYIDNKMLFLQNVLNTCLCLVKSLIDLLLVSVSEDFWVQEHKSKIHRDIAHKSCMAMRMLGDLMTKFK